MSSSKYLRRPLRYLFAMLAAVLVIPVAVPPARAADDEKIADSAESLIQEALHRERYGLQQERDELLVEALKHDPENALAKWHQGRMRHDHGWVDAERVAERPDDTPTMKDYASRRDLLIDNADGNLMLANWCRDNKLPMQERAHLSRVLDFNPDHAAVRERLGYRQVSGAWVTKGEIQLANQRREKEAIASGKWRSVLVDVLRDLQGADATKKVAATERLSKIKDVHAIPVMESVLSLGGEPSALAVVERVARMQGPEATASLIRHAILSAWPKVRDSAAEQLVYRKRESYVPLLLQEMYTPVVSQFGVAQTANGRLGYRHSFQREGQEERQLLVLDTEYRRERRMGGDGMETLMRAFLDSLSGISQREVAATQQNMTQLTLNRRISEALNIATNQQLSPDPYAWWKWWDEENDLVRMGDKQLRKRQQYEQIRVADRPIYLSGGETSSYQPRAECFVAGTAVLTRNGNKPIETIQVGDLVLAQNIETGELAFKPVLRTTVRPAGELVKIRVGRDSLETSKGHLFWVAGQGWAKSRHLESGMQLHAMHGSVPVSIVEKGSSEETFNLVVADFHTYFVGSQRILSHDVTSRQATHATMPGLQDE